MISNHSQPHQHTKQRDTVSLVLRALAVLLLLLIFLHGHGWAQGIKPTGNAVLVHFNGAPSGSCFSFNVAVDDTAGNFYDCFLGSWFQVNGTGGTGGSGTVTHTLGALTLNAFVLGNGGADVKTGTATTTNLSDVSATAATDGQLLIFDGPSSTYIPGDPKVQGLAADGATTVLNPVEIGGYDTAGTPAIHRAIWINGNPAGTEYGLVTRNIPSGTQPVSGTVAVSNFPTTQPVSIAAAVTVAQATGTNLHAVLDTASTTTVTQATAANLNGTVVGTKTDNSAVPSTTNLGTLPAIGNAAPPSKTEGNQVALSTDLAGNLRVYNHPPNVLGCYMVNGRTPTYAGLAAAQPLYSFRWGTATGALAVIMRVRVNVATTVTSTTTSGAAERELIVVRSFTASDTGGTAIVLTGNNQKMRTSQATSLVTDMRAGGPLTAGTRTLDANPISSVLSWLGVNFTGVDIGSGGASTSTAATAWTGLGGVGMIPLLDAVNGQDYPLVLAQNEGFIIRIGKDAQPTGFTQQTYFNISWCEVSAY